MAVRAKPSQINAYDMSECIQKMVLNKLHIKMKTKF